MLNLDAWDSELLVDIDDDRDLAGTALLERADMVDSDLQGIYANADIKMTGEWPQSNNATFNGRESHLYEMPERKSHLRHRA